MRNLNPEPKIVIGNFDSLINISYICSDKTIFINKIIKSMQRKCILSVAFVFAALSLANCQREPAVQPVAEADGNFLPVAPSNPRYNYCKNYKTIRYDKPTN